MNPLDPIEAGGADRGWRLADLLPWWAWAACAFVSLSIAGAIDPFLDVGGLNHTIAGVAWAGAGALLTLAAQSRPPAPAPPWWREPPPPVAPPPPPPPPPPVAPPPVERRFTPRGAVIAGAACSMIGALGGWAIGGLPGSAIGALAGSLVGRIVVD